MDPHLRWLRRLVIARAAERLAIEATVVGGGAALGAAARGWRPAEVLATFVTLAMITATLRFGLALSTNPVNHRYLLQWTDPSGRLRVSDRGEPRRSDDPTSRELQAGSFRFLARLERSDDNGNLAEVGAGSDAGPDDEPDNDPDDDRPGIDVYRAEGGRLVVTRSDDDEITVLSRLDDGRTVVTSAGFIPPTDRLLVKRAGGGPGQIPTDALIGHVERLLVLRAEGIEAVATDIDDVIDLVHAEWEAWQEIGPFVGPFLAVEPSRRPGLTIQVDVPDGLIRDRIGSGLAPRAARTRSRPAAD